MPKYTKFDLAPFCKAISPDRMQAVTARDAINDPHQTIGSWKDPFSKDPGCHMSDLKKRSTVQQDLKTKAIVDNQNRVIVKCDNNYGHRTAGLFL